MGLFDFGKKAREERERKEREEAERRRKAAEEQKRKAAEEAERQRKAEEERKRKAAEEAEQKRLDAEKQEATDDNIHQPDVMKETNTVTNVPVAKEEEIKVSLFEELFQLSTRVKREQREKEQREEQERAARITPILQRLYPIIEQKMKEIATKKGYSSIHVRFKNSDEHYNKISSPTFSEYGSDLFVPGVAGDYSSNEQSTAGKILAEHYKQEGFDADTAYEGASISWGSEQDKFDKEARFAAFKARVENVKSAKILGTVISEEGSNGNMTNYVMHTIRLIYQDDSKDLITIRESDPFVQAIIEKLEN